MHATSQYPGAGTTWQEYSDQRLRFSMLLSAIFVAAALSLVKLPPPAKMLPLLELVVELSRTEPVIRPAADVVPEQLQTPPLPDEPDDTQQEPILSEPEALPATLGETAGQGEPADWEARKIEAIKQVLDALELEASVSINPTFEKARREASVRFRASLAPDQLHMWDNVEKDQVGRTILRLGDGSCFRVLDDPSAMNRWAYENFDRNIVYCEFAFGGKKGRELPWVDIIRERYPYLRDPVEIP